MSLLANAIKNILKIIFLIIFFSKASYAIENSELKVTLQSSKISLDPGEIQDSQSLFVSRQVNCQLVRNQGSIYILDAAESIKYVTPLKIILKINQKLKFHDESLIKAEDVLASLNYINQSRNVFRSLSEWVEKLEQIDETTIIFSLKKPTPQFLKVLSATNYTIFPKNFLEKAQKNKKLWEKPIGCGGYKVSEFNKENIKLTPVGMGLPINFILNKNNQINANELTKYDVVTLKIIGKSTEFNNFSSIKMLDPLQFFIGLNANSPMWKNAEERCHFLTNIDIRIIFNNAGNMIVANDLLPIGTLGYNTSQHYNNEMLTIGNRFPNYRAYDHKNTLCLSYLTVSISEEDKSKYLEMIQKFYPKILTKPIENVGKFGRKFVNDKCDVLLFALKGNYFDGYEYLTIFENNDANFSGIKNKNLSERILKSQSITDASARAKEYQEIVKMIAKLCVIRPLITIPNREIYVRKTLMTPNIGLISIHQYYLGNISRKNSNEIISS